jgi:hypothetical protein
MKPLSIAITVLVLLGSAVGWSGGTPAAAQQLSVTNGPQWDSFVAAVRERVRDAQSSTTPGEADLPLVDSTSPPPSADSAIVTLARIVASMAESLAPDLVPRDSRELGDGWIYQVVLNLPRGLHLRGGSEFETLGLRAIEGANDVARHLTQVAPDFAAAMMPPCSASLESGSASPGKASNEPDRPASILERSAMRKRRWRKASPPSPKVATAMRFQPTRLP